MVLLGSNLTDIGFCEAERCGCPAQELQVFLMEGVDIVATVEATIHNELDLLIVQDIQFANELTNRFDVRYVPGKLPVIERQAAVLSEQESQVDLRKVFTVLVLAVLDLLYRFRIAGDGSAVIGPVFFFRTAFAL